MSLPAFNSEKMTVWAVELPDGKRYDIVWYIHEDRWVIDEVFWDEYIDDWDTKEVYQGSDPERVFEIMKKCGVKFLTP